VLTSAIAPLDGQPWVFFFTGLSAGIAKITIDFTGTKPAGIGQLFRAHDNGLFMPQPQARLTALTLRQWPHRGRG